MKKEDFINILEKYNLGAFRKAEHMGHAHANEVYKLSTTKGTYLLKELLIFDKKNPKSSLKFKKVQQKLMLELTKKKIPVPIIIPSKDNQLLVSYNGEKILIQTFAPGKSVKTLTDKLTTDLARNVAIMNNLLIQLTKTHKYKVPVQKNLMSLNHVKYNLEGVNISKLGKTLQNQIKKLNKKRFTYSIIHRDIRGDNIVVNKGKVTSIVDWDDIREYYISYDLGVIIGSFFAQPRDLRIKQIKIFLKEYQKHYRFSDEEQKAMYYFALYRLLEVIAFFNWKKKLKPEKAKAYEVAIQHVKQKYLSLAHLGVHDFINLFNTNNA